MVATAVSRDLGGSFWIGVRSWFRPRLVAAGVQSKSQQNQEKEDKRQRDQKAVTESDGTRTWGSSACSDKLKPAPGEAVPPPSESSAPTTVTKKKTRGEKKNLCTVLKNKVFLS